MKLQRWKRQTLFAALLIIIICFLSGCASNAVLRISKMPQINYVLGESLSLEGGRITIDDGSLSFEVTMTDPAVTYTGYDARVLGEQTITLAYRYREKVLTASYKVIVSETPAEAIGIEIVSFPIKNEYVDGQSFDPEGLLVKAILSDRTERILLKEEYAVEVGTPLSVLDNGRAEVRYKSFTTTFLLVVEPRVKVALQLLTSPVNAEYLTGEAFDLTGATFRYLMNDDTYEEVTKPLTFSDNSADNKKLVFGVTEMILTDGKLFVSVPITVLKHVVMIDASKIRVLYLSANKKLQDPNFLRSLYLEIDVRTIKGLTIDGKEQSTKEMFTINAHNTETETLKIETTASTIKLHLYYLLSFMKKEITLETEEENIVINLTNATDIKAQAEGQSLLISALDMTESYAVIVSADKTKVWLRVLSCNASGSYIDLTGVDSADIWIDASKVVVSRVNQNTLICV